MSCFIGKEDIGFLNYSFPGYLASSIIFALCIVSLDGVSLPSLSGKVEQTVIFVSGMTYSLFLCHAPMWGLALRIREWLSFHFPGMAVDWLIPVAALLFSLLASYVIHEYLEKRWVKWARLKMSAA